MQWQGSPPPPPPPLLPPPSCYANAARSAAEPCTSAGVRGSGLCTIRAEHVARRHHSRHRPPPPSRTARWQRAPRRPSPSGAQLHPTPSSAHTSCGCSRRRFTKRRLLSASLLPWLWRCAAEAAIRLRQAHGQHFPATQARRKQQTLVRLYPARHASELPASEAVRSTECSGHARLAPPLAAAERGKPHRHHWRQGRSAGCKLHGLQTQRHEQQGVRRLGECSPA